MFKIKVKELNPTKIQKKTLYQIRYELVPDISKGVEKIKYHESIYTNLRTALRVGDCLAEYLTESYYFLDLIYTKIKQLEITVSDLPQYLRVDFNRVETTRAVLMRGMMSPDFAYKHIDRIKDFINNLKHWCFCVSKDFQNIANRLFTMLISFEESFKNCYRSSQMLSEKNSLKLFF